MKRPKLAGVFLLLAVLLAYLMFVRNHYWTSRPDLFPPHHHPADGRTADGRPADGRTADGRTADGRTADGWAADGRPADGRTADGRTADGRTADGRTADGWTADGRTADGRTADGWAADGRTADGRTADGRTADSRTADGRPADGWAADGRTTDGRTADGRTAGAGRSFRYGVMFDAGSTGTRVHIFRFQMENKEPPRLDHETFRAIKPGLSAYADEPHKCSEGILQLLQVAQSSVPPSSWTSTPLVLKATAGLRLLPGEKAQHLLDTVRALFLESPFLSRDDSVSIMDGTDEGISAWITVNFLTGGLHGDGSTVGMLDLGGGSTQITFSPQDQKTIQTSPIDDIRSFQMFNITHTVYTHSYLGLGLMSARLAILGGVDAPPLGGSTELVSPCLPADFSGSWEHADITYTVKGQKAGEPVYEACLNKVEKVLYRKVLKASEVADLDFYAFSYYYDRALDLELIDEQQGGTVSVSQFTDAARRVCSDSSSIRPLQSPFLCLDLVYISVLLQELGFPPSKEFKLARTINQVETSWALGAAFHYMESLKNL